MERVDTAAARSHPVRLGFKGVGIGSDNRGVVAEACVVVADPQEVENADVAVFAVRVVRAAVDERSGEVVDSDRVGIGIGGSVDVVVARLRNRCGSRSGGRRRRGARAFSKFACVCWSVLRLKV